jgi:hypothetical protein
LGRERGCQVRVCEGELGAAQDHVQNFRPGVAVENELRAVRRNDHELSRPSPNPALRGIDRQFVVRAEGEIQIRVYGGLDGRAEAISHDHLVVIMEFVGVAVLGPAYQERMVEAQAQSRGIDIDAA